MFNEENFINNFVQYCIDSTESYDIKVLFDDYINNIVFLNSQEINEYIIRKYDNPANVDIITNIHHRVAQMINFIFKQLLINIKVKLIQKNVMKFM